MQVSCEHFKAVPSMVLSALTGRGHDTIARLVLSALEQGKTYPIGRYRLIQLGVGLGSGRNVAHDCKDGCCECATGQSAILQGNSPFQQMCSSWLGCQIWLSATFKPYHDSLTDESTPN